MPVLTIVGSGTLVPDARRYSSAHHLRTAAASCLLDCGPGAVQRLARFGIAWEELTHVAITHFHNDHVGDLGALMMAFAYGLRSPRTEPLTLVGPAGVRDFLRRLTDALGGHVTDPGFELRVVELGSGDAFEDADHEVLLTCHPTPHTTESVCYRLEGTWGAVGYTGDTGPSDGVADFLTGCDVLVAECNFPDAERADAHLSPASLARLAEAARPALLVVVHVGPAHSPEEVLARVSERYTGRVVAAVDGTRVRLGAGGPSVDPAVTAV